MNTLPEVPLISPDDRVRQHLRVAPMGREVNAVEPRDACHQLLCQYRHLRISGEQMRMKISMHNCTRLQRKHSGLQISPRLVGAYHVLDNIFEGGGKKNQARL